jgi:hypothetical protein
MATLDGNGNVVPHDVVMSGDTASFTEYCRHLITSTIAEMILIVRSTSPDKSTSDRDKALKWSEIWTEMFK